jgi:hypothetical protein
MAAAFEGGDVNMYAAGILLIALALATPQGQQTTRSQSTTASRDWRQLYSPSPGHLTSPLYERGDTWYEFLLKQFNPDDIDYGSWLERRRQVFLEASVQNPYFKYSAGVTLVLMFMTLLLVKQRLDHRRSMWITAEMMTDLYNHDVYSRQIAREAIGRYNDHVERCNRAIEGSEHGVSITDSEADQLRTELQSVTTERDSYRRERDLAKHDLAEKERVLADMSLRLDALVKKAESGRGSLSTSSQIQDGDQKLVHHINTLQEQLYAERRENRRLKGA